MVMRPRNLEKMVIECPECGAEAKCVKQPLLDKIKGKRTPGARFKCTKCEHEFQIMF